MATALTISAPKSYQVFQRGGDGKANISITGTYTGAAPVTVEASWNGGAWTVIDAAANGGLYSGTLAAQSGGQGTLTVRDSENTGVTASVTYVGVGDVFIVAGQSNAAGELTNMQSYSHATLKASHYKYTGSVWAELTDPTGANTLKGSVWPLLATLIMANQGVPVAFIPTAQGSTTLVASPAHWAKGGARYVDMLARLSGSGVNGVKAVLWYQGETDASSGISQSAYATALSQMISDMRTDSGMALQLVAALIGEVSAVSDANLTAIRAAIVDRWSNDGNVLPGPSAADYNFADGTHWTTNGEASVLAGRWWRCLRAHFYGNATEPARAPKIISVNRAGAVVGITFDGGTGTLQNQTAATGWVYTDNGVGVTISSAAAGSSMRVDLTLASTPTGANVEQVKWLPGANGSNATLSDTGATAVLPPEPSNGGITVVVTPPAAGGQGWWR